MENSTIKNVVGRAVRETTTIVSEKIRNTGKGTTIDRRIRIERRFGLRLDCGHVIRVADADKNRCRTRAKCSYCDFLLEGDDAEANKRILKEQAEYVDV